MDSNSPHFALGRLTGLDHQIVVAADAAVAVGINTVNC